MAYDSLLFVRTTEDRMAWTEIAREQYDWRHLRYANNCTDEEWALIGHTIPTPAHYSRLFQGYSRTLLALFQGHNT